MIRALLLLSVLVSTVTGFAPAAHACPQSRPDGDIVVALRDNAEPFAYFDAGGAPAGFAYDLWRRVERSLYVLDDVGRAVAPEVTFVACNTIDGQEIALVSGRIDVVIAPLTITSQRMESYDFSQQYLSSGLALALPPSNAIDFSQAKDIVAETILHPTVAQAVLLFLTFNLVMAFLIRWLLFGGDSATESRTSTWLRSLLESIIRTIGLRGVGDGYSTAVAKVLEIFLAVVGTALSATLLGVLTSAFVGSVGAEQKVPAAGLTQMSIATLDCSTAQALLLTEYGKRKGDVEAGTAEAAALDLRVSQLVCNPEDPEREDITVDDSPDLAGSVRLVSSWRQAANLLVEGKVDGVLGDWIALTYLSRQDTWAGQMAVLPTVYRNEPYGWGISNTSVSEDLRRQIDRALIRQMRNRDWRKRLEDVLGTGSVSPN
ncbi:transporter substrate-binding domain-containing protein [uncultured Roseobacter sp.]|uniref:transporter substrate-binding domain-containing protein n=1 Tax=uncultured Roseobacter sp. TaxID=114847 RepID=UPI00260E4905|nr:transporter substrate-binding domain-containing protein [uncultured Roseobacter sp.]